MAQNMDKQELSFMFRISILVSRSKEKVTIEGI
jgi:hypothetical protein